MATSYQDQRSVKVTTPLGKDVLLFARMSAAEHVSQLFHLDLTLLSDQGDINADKLLGKPLGVTIQLDEKHKRYFHGLVTEFSQTGYEERRHEYRAVVRPWLWFLTRTADCRIFQNKNVPDIFKDVCRQAGFTDHELRLGSSYDPWEYCVQYRETDFNFLSRLLEQEGIFYFFEHSENKHTLVLCDDVGKCNEVTGYDSVPYYPPTTAASRRERDHLSAWSFQKSFQPGTYAVRDFDFKKPTQALAGTSTISRQHDAAKFEVYDYPAEPAKLDGKGVERVAKIRVQEQQVTQLTARGSGDAAGLSAGRVFKLTDYPRSDLNIKYLITSASIEVTADNYQTGGTKGDDDQYHVSLEAVDSREHYRPPRITPKPVVQGTQTAIVVGSKGEEIWTDEFGRIKVQFHWDRYGKEDENSSCWIRVGSPWAGKNWGAISIPRIGHEVIVAFLEGDPDHPIVVGSVYNGANKPPYALSANQTQSGVKTRSSKGGTAENCNEIRFEDKKGSEQLYIHAEKNQDISVEADETHSVGHDRTKTIDHDETVHVKHDRTETVDNNETITISGNRTISVGKDESATVGGKRDHTVGKAETIEVGDDQSITIAKSQTQSIGKDQTEDVGGAQTLSVAKDQSVSVSGNQSVDVAKAIAVSAGKTYALTAADSITLTTGSASITMKKDGTITIKGKDITIEGSGKINVKASSDVIIKGSKIQQN
jgi:type VI secretion system secreted protein VgrG